MFSQIARRLDGLRARYAEPHRAYHGQRHIDTLLVAPLWDFDAPAMVELAIWYHDAIYQIPAEGGAGGNERASAGLLRSDLAGLADNGLIEDAAALILATARHAIPSDLPSRLTADCARFLDLDLSILGAAAADYDQYAAGIAAEYVPAIGEDAYRTGRLAFLRGALGRRLFLTDAAEARFGAAAAANLAREAQTLGGP